ncbi:GNAT family N-acetyltransferase [Paenibacillus thalictri]|uniref:GNAT family N-acetyltransferase n=1 Tax=Paenibacillus thalictri TaxID=2527873 RepID=A0A4Q9E1H1_9BACL|nr:GNAT family N-acetyltransferase [Paenibacillus thalictri]
MLIIPLTMDHYRSLLRLYSAVKRDLRAKRIYQWDWFYPNRFVIRGDIKSEILYGIVRGGVVLGAVALDEQLMQKTAALPWEDTAGRPACIHRLAVHPDHQGKGIGKRLLQFAEVLAGTRGNTSIRLDVYSQNETAVAMYERAGYTERGYVYYPLRKVPYVCMEKSLIVQPQRVARNG